jgi:hypothetical protein
MVVTNHLSYGRIMRDSGIANNAGVATKAKIIHRNQQILVSLVYLLKEKKKMLSILN